MNGRFTLEDLVALLERLCPTSVVELHDSYAHVVCGGLDYDAYVTGTDIGRRAISLACELGPVGVIEDRVSLAKILENLAGCAAVRLVVVGDRLAFETCVTPDDLSPDRLDAVVRWHLTELTAVAGAWRRRLGIAPDAPAPRDVKTLDELVRTTPVPPQKALLVAMVGFAVAGADGRISAREVSRLQSWFKDVPSFATLDQRRVTAAVATLVSDSARTLFEARRRLEPRERLLAWALANDMAHADGFTSPDERRYLSNVASIFELSLEEMAPFVADAQERAVGRETLPTPLAH